MTPKGASDKMDASPFSTVIIRLGCVDDAGPVRVLLGDLGYPCSIDLVRRRLEQLSLDPDEDFLVAASREDEVLGFISVHYTSRKSLWRATLPASVTSASALERAHAASAE